MFGDHCQDEQAKLAIVEQPSAAPAAMMTVMSIAAAAIGKVVVKCGMAPCAVHVSVLHNGRYMSRYIDSQDIS
jgi:hypothetical protein